MPERIAFVTTVECPWGGSEELWGGAARSMARSGDTVFANVQFFDPVSPRVRDLSDAGCKVTLRRYRRPRRIFRPLQFRWLDLCRPDLVVISLAAHHHGEEWMRMCSNRRIPYALIVQSCDETKFPADADAAFLAAGYRNALRCYFVSQNNVNFVERSLAISLRNVSIVRNPFNVGFDVSVPWPSGSLFRLACVARLEPTSKGQDLLFQALSHNKWSSRGLEVNCFGSGLSGKTLKQLASQLGLRNVKFKGFVADIASVWRENHALVLPSRFEGLPLSIVEAMLCRRPCIVTDVSGNAEMIKDGVHGFVAAAPTVFHIDEALEKAWARRDCWQEMGINAGRRIRELVPENPIGVFVSELMSLPFRRNK